MHIVVHHSSYYNWEPLPADVTPTEADIAAKRVIPAKASSGDAPAWLMKVTKKQDTHTTMTIPEMQIIQIIIGDAMRDRGWHNRSQAVAQYVARVVMPHHAHRKHIGPTGLSDGETFEIEHDEPDPALFQQQLDLHTRSDANPQGEISPEDVDALMELYMQPTTPEHHVDALHSHFRVSKDARGAKGHHHGKKGAAQLWQR